MLLFLGLLMFIMLVIFHEFGHYLAAKRTGVVVEEFGIGFPPRAAAKRFKAGGTLYSINWLPLGGFVKLKGEHDADKTKDSYGAATMGQKTFILLAGVAMNLLAAVVILTILSWSGLPKLVDGQFSVPSDTKIIQNDVLITYVAEGSPADQAGLAVGDRVVSLNGQPVESADQLAPMTELLAGQTVAVEIEADNQNYVRQIRFNSAASDEGYLGVGPGNFVVERSTWSAPVKGTVLSGQFAWLTLKGVVTTLGQLFTGQGGAAADNVAGPVGIVVLLSDISQAGVSFVLMFVALISVTLAVMNALPIPALDGGRLFVSWLFKLLKRPLKAATEERIHATGMAVLMGLVILITFIDVRRFF